ncbi:MAG: ACT domain-containing protein [Gaiellaceae bacterium]
MRLTVHGDRYAVVSLDPGAEVPAWATAGPVSSVTRTESELSIVCREDVVPAAASAERGWRVLEVAGPLDFTLTGVLASLAAPLAAAEITLFALSTFETDYLLVRERDLSRATDALRAAGHTV